MTVCTALSGRSLTPGSRQGPECVAHPKPSLKRRALPKSGLHVNFRSGLAAKIEVLAIIGAIATGLLHVVVGSVLRHDMIAHAQ